MTSLVFDNFSLLADGTHGVARLRALILDLAIRGRLCAQDRSDEPACALLAATSVNCVAPSESAKTRRSSGDVISPQLMEDFSLPPGWLWTSICNVADVIRGVSYSKNDARDKQEPGFVPLLRANNIDRAINYDRLLFVPKGVISSDQYVKRGDIVIALSSGSADLVGKAAPVTDDFTGTFGAFCGVVRARTSALLPYLAFFFGTPFYRTKAAGMGKGIGINNLQKSALEKLPIPIPPIAEQHRIIAKVDELMALCDRLEARQQDAEAAHRQLVQVLLDRLTQARDAEELRESWERVAAHFDVLFTTEESVASLESTIRFLAVTGKLVTGSTAAGIVRMIDGTSFELPANWSSKRLGDIATVERGGSPRPIADYITSEENGLNWIKIGDTEIGGKFITSTAEKIRPEGLHKTRMVYPGDFLLTNSMSFGRPYITKIAGCIHDGWLRISPPKALNSDFLYVLLSSPFVQEFFQRAAAGAVVMNLNAEKVRALPVPLPPLEEQYRIVTKVEELMSICERLRRAILNAHTKHVQLAEALVASAFAT